MDYQALEEHIKDSVMEEQAKLGFCKEVIRLYYPVGMLNKLFGPACDADEKQQADVVLARKADCWFLDA